MYPVGKVRLKNNDMTDQLRRLYWQTKDSIAPLQASSSSHVPSIEARLALIEKRFHELEGMNSIERGMKHTTISEQTPMAVDATPQKYVSRTVQVKQQAIASWEKTRATNGRCKTGIMDPEEAQAIDKEKLRLEQERRRRIEAKKEKRTMPTRVTSSGRQLSEKEYEERIRMFMNYKPSESDMEDDDDTDEDDEDDDDPITWFHDDQDDGIKGQDIVYPDAEDFSDVIRVDGSKFPY